MAQTQISEKAGATGNTFQGGIGYNPQFSGFDLSRKCSTTVSECQVFPLDFFRLLPGDKLDVSCRYILDAMPQVVPPQTNYKFIIQLWHTRLEDLWKGADTFITKGRSGNVSLTIPSCRYDALYTDDKTLVDQDANGYYLSTPHSLSTYLNLPPLRYSLAEEHIGHTPAYLPYVCDYTDADYADEDSSPRTHFNALETGVNALIPFFYQKICRTMLPTNLLQNNKVWFPEDISNADWRLSWNGDNLDEDGHFVPMNETLPDTPIANHVPHAGAADDPNNDNCVNIWQSRYVQYGDDLFTTAKPWLVRNEETTLDMNVSDLGLKITDAIDYDGMGATLAAADGLTWSSLSDAQKKAYTDCIGINFTYINNNPDSAKKYGNSDGLFDGASTAAFSSGVTRGTTGGTSGGIGFNGISGAYANCPTRPGIHLGFSGNYYGIGSSSTSAFAKNFVVLKPDELSKACGFQFIGSPRVALTANTLRSLIAFSIKDEIDALTNGNYNSTVKAHFARDPNHPDFEPRYIGGTVDYINFGSVMQTSESSDSSPMGTVAGIGGSSAGGYLGHIESSDFGYAMVIGMIVPEVTYSDGITHEWTDLTQDTVWFPEWANLGFEPVKNQEIKISGTDAIDNDLFGYQTRGIEYKQRRNTVSGLFQLNPDEDMMFSAYNQCRLFNTVPELCNEFTTAAPNNTRRDYLAFPELPTYRLQYASDVKAVRPLPYKSVPARFGM